MLNIVQCRLGKFTVPLEPAGGLDDVANLFLHHHRQRVPLRRPTEVTLEAAIHHLEVGGSTDLATLDDDASVLVVDFPTWGCDYVALAEVRTTGADITVFEDNGGVAEDKVDSPNDEASGVELAEGVDVQSVLVF